MSSVAGERVGGLSGHKVCELRVEVYFGTLPLPMARWFCFQRLVLLSVHLAVARAAIRSMRSGGRGTRARPNLGRRSREISEQVRHRAQRRTFQSGEFLISLGDLCSFLFPSNLFNCLIPMFRRSLG